jgi:hypothetical protein
LLCAIYKAISVPTNAVDEEMNKPSLKKELTPGFPAPDSLKRRFEKNYCSV